MDFDPCVGILIIQEDQKVTSSTYPHIQNFMSKQLLALPCLSRY